MSEFDIPGAFVARVCHVHPSSTTDPLATEVRDMLAPVVADRLVRPGVRAIPGRVLQGLGLSACSSITRTVILLPYVDGCLSHQYRSLVAIRLQTVSKQHRLLFASIMQPAIPM